ncbi:unnamed protein product [Thlaspi arvense]|uniref:Uncharacterized protein n=1 Tax=Thlaspi arvense TaxID=13288 RepID=A0AAU9S494_THLAR|nr:unnamed protein product [Thlaspi arvense]
MSRESSPFRVGIASIKASTSTKYDAREPSRRSANYQPSSWSIDFLESLGDSLAVQEMNRDKAKKLEERVRWMIDDKSSELSNLLLLIDEIQRLGLGYRFGESITRALNAIISPQGPDKKTIMDNLNVTSVYFRLLRQHGYDVSSDKKGMVSHTHIQQFHIPQYQNFGASLLWDFRGLLNLYEASYLAFVEEDALEQARAFAGGHLNNLKNNNNDPSVMEHINHTVELPLHHRMHMQEARWYTEAYGKRKDVNHFLLELAKHDFNHVQFMLQSEIKEVSRWWLDMGLTKSLGFVKDRPVECFLWAVGMVPEPQFSDCRKGLAKVFALVLVMDDMYDVYGSLDELELFTDAVERWDVNNIENLPDYMKICFQAFYNTVNDLTYGKERVIPYLRKAWTELCKAFLKEANWFYNECTPTLKDYLDNAWISSSGVVLLVHAYILLSQTTTNEGFKCLENNHDLLRYPSLIFRLSNDLATSTSELVRGETTNAVWCYVKETSLSEKQAREHVSNMLHETWKKMNKLLVLDSPLRKLSSRHVLTLLEPHNAHTCTEMALGLPIPERIVKFCPC